MLGQRRFETKLYYQLSLDHLVPEDHLLRRSAAAVDFSFVRPLCRPFYSHTGQPSVDPVVLFKMLLVGYLYGITSERRLAQEISLNLAYRWFLGYDLDEPTPNHSVLSKARARFSAAVFEEFFRRSIELCRSAGLVTEGPGRQREAPEGARHLGGLLGGLAGGRRNPGRGSCGAAYLLGNRLSVRSP